MELSAAEADRRLKKVRGGPPPQDVAQRQVQVESFGEEPQFRSCQPSETGAGFTSNLFSVASFKTACEAALQNLTNQCANVTPASATDTHWLRIPTLAEELSIAETEAVASDAQLAAAAEAANFTTLPSQAALTPGKQSKQSSDTSSEPTAKPSDEAKDSSSPMANSLPAASLSTASTRSRRLATRSQDGVLVSADETKAPPSQSQQQLTAKGANKIKQWKVMEANAEAGVRLAAEVRQRRSDRLAHAQQVLESLRPDSRPATQRRNINYLPVEALASSAAADSEAQFGADAGPMTASSNPCADNQSTTDRVASGEVILTVSVSHPSSAQRVAQVWQVLGSNTLTDLRDRIYCRSDIDLKATGLNVPSGCVYVEGTFYNDMRNSEAIDYSYPIRTFCHEHSILPPRRPSGASAATNGSEPLGLQSAFRTAFPMPQFRDATDADGGGTSAQEPVLQGGNTSVPDAAASWSNGASYQCADMAATTFDRLWLRLGFGAGYVYLHQGCCEHLLSFTDVRLVHPDDRQLQSQYPALDFQARLRRRTCRLCDASPASKVTYDDAHAPENPCFWCDKCFADMHYDKDKQLVVDKEFKVFDYLHD